MQFCIWALDPFEKYMQQTSWLKFMLTAHNELTLLLCESAAWWIDKAHIVCFAWNKMCFHVFFWSDSHTPNHKPHSLHMDSTNCLLQHPSSCYSVMDVLQTFHGCWTQQLITMQLNITFGHIFCRLICCMHKMLIFYVQVALIINVSKHYDLLVINITLNQHYIIVMTM